MDQRQRDCFHSSSAWLRGILTQINNVWIVPLLAWELWCRDTKEEKKKKNNDWEYEQEKPRWSFGDACLYEPSLIISNALGPYRGRQYNINAMSLCRHEPLLVFWGELYLHQCDFGSEERQNRSIVLFCIKTYETRSYTVHCGSFHKN